MKLKDEILIVKVEYSNDDIDELRVLKNNVSKKLSVSTNYYNLDMTDRTDLLNLMIEWSTKELTNITNIKNRNIEINL